MGVSTLCNDVLVLLRLRLLGRGNDRGRDAGLDTCFGFAVSEREQVVVSSMVRRLVGVFREDTSKNCERSDTGHILRVSA